jgi:DNA-binding MarR family transcriptional regulator
MIHLADPDPREDVTMAGSSAQREDPIDRLGRAAYITTFVASNRLTDQIEHLCRAERISHAQYTALWVLCLSEEPDGLPMGALVDGLLHRKADATRLVNVLLDSGYVTREPSPGDRRVVLVKPTKTGRQLFERLTREIKSLHREQWAALDAEELRQLIGLLNKALWSGAPAPTDASASAPTTRPSRAS